MIVCVGDCYDVVCCFVYFVDLWLYVGGFFEGNYLLCDFGLEWNCKKGSKWICVIIIFNLVLKIFVYLFFYC